MPVLSSVASAIKERGKLKGARIAMALHVEAKTACLAIALREAGAEVRLASCNPMSTDDSVALALNEKYGLETYARKGEEREEYYNNLNSVLDVKPGILVDDGADIITLVHSKRRELLSGVIGANEETTTGVVRLRAMEKDGKLLFPVIAVNDYFTCPGKTGFFGLRYEAAGSAHQEIFWKISEISRSSSEVNSRVTSSFMSEGIISRPILAAIFPSRIMA